MTGELAAALISELLNLGLYSAQLGLYLCRLMDGVENDRIDGGKPGRGKKN